MVQASQVGEVDCWVISAILLLGIGAAIGSSEEDDLKGELSEAQAALARSKAAQADAEATAERLLDRRDALLSKARSQASAIVGTARSQSSKLSSELNTLRSSIDSAEGELSSVEASLEGAKETKAKSTIPSSDTFQAEVDFIPGTYEAAGGPGCYWATLNSADPFDIASNENATGPTIASITSPYFQTQECGTWTRIGE